MSFGLYNNLISNKMREEMYLKHLREVQKINNRDADSLKKDLKDYRCISELHKHNKQKIHYIKTASKNLEIEKKNEKIYHKIQSISSDQNIKQKIRPNSYTLDKSRNTEDISSIHTRSDHKKPTLHSRYRQDQQQKIQLQNRRIAKAIIGQKSLLLPLIKHHKVKPTSMRNSFSQNQTHINLENNDSSQLNNDN